LVITVEAASLARPTVGAIVVAAKSLKKRKKEGTFSRRWTQIYAEGVVHKETASPKTTPTFPFGIIWIRRFTPPTKPAAPGSYPESFL
jgi:hypothetical protein